MLTVSRPRHIYPHIYPLNNGYRDKDTRWSYTAVRLPRLGLQACTPHSSPSCPRCCLIAHCPLPRISPSLSLAESSSSLVALVGSGARPPRPAPSPWRWSPPRTAVRSAGIPSARAPAAPPPGAPAGLRAPGALRSFAITAGLSSPS